MSRSWNRSLTKVLKHAGLGPKGARAIAIALVNNTDIHHLDLSSSDVEVEGGMTLGEMLQHNRALGSLVLADNRIAEGGRAIADGLVSNKTLLTLSLRGIHFMMFYCNMCTVITLRIT